MAATRLTPLSGTGASFAASVREEVLGLWDKAALPLTSEAGTANAITASLAPVLNDGLKDGMTFWLTPSLTNTATAVTLSINGDTPVDLVDSQGDALAVGALQAGLTRQCLYVAADNNFRVLGTAESTKVLAYQAFTASGTWTKPTAAPAGSWVLIEVWAGGAGGYTNAGGGGGAYNSRIMQLSDLSGSVAVTVGAGGVGGASATSGGNSSFGAYCLAYGGAADANGGGGGGAMSAGSGQTGGGPGGGYDYLATDSATNTVTIPFAHSAAGGGKGQGATVVGDSDTGGGGGALSGNGGNSRYGGGGGAGGSGTGGVSQYGGNGGDDGAAGVAPGGGGGKGAAGARGEVRIWVIG
jgi:hypothetical protein